MIAPASRSSSASRAQWGSGPDDPVLADPRVLVYHPGPVDIGVLIVIVAVVVGFAVIDWQRHR